MRRLIHWLNNEADGLDRALFTILAGLVLGIVIILGIMQHRYYTKLNAPCSELGGLEIKELPVRCYAYYGLKAPEN